MTSEELHRINPTLENVPEKLRSVRQIAPDIPNVILDFAEYMADMAHPLPHIVETLWCLFYDAKDLIVAEDQTVPKTLKGKMPEIFDNIESFYILVDKISSKEFSEKFRALSLFDK